jgi:hypothetical protein
MERWSAEWGGAWLIAIASSDERPWPWTGAAEADAEHLFHRTFPSIHAHLKPWEDRLRARHDQGRYWWEMRPRGEHDVAHGYRIVHPEISFHPQFAFADAAAVVLASACVWPTADPYLLAVANSAVAWTWLRRSAMHGKDDALRLTPHALEHLPVAPPPPALKPEIDASVERLVELTAETRALTRQLMGWLRDEHGIAAPDGELLGFAELNATAFVDAVRRHLPRGAEPLSPRQVGMLRNAHAEFAPHLTAVQARAAGLEHRLSQLVVRCYGLAPDDVARLWTPSSSREAAPRG